MNKKKKLGGIEDAVPRDKLNPRAKLDGVILGIV